MKRGSILIFCLFATVSSEAQDDPRLTQSREITVEFQQELSARLISALGAGGPVEAIGICSADAPTIAARLSEEAGARVGRTALKVRNPDNAPDAAAHTVLTAFERGLAAGATVPPEHFETRPDGSARYLRAIVTQPLCLGCHGSELAPEVAAAVAEHYPTDQATGFGLGDLRGAFLIEWPASTAGD